MGQEEGGSRTLSRGAAWDRRAAALHWQGASRWRLGSLPQLTTSAHCLGSRGGSLHAPCCATARLSLLISRRAAQAPVGGCGAAVRPGQPILQPILRRASTAQVSEGSNGTVDVTNFHTSWQVSRLVVR